MIANLYRQRKLEVERVLIAKHGIIAAMRGDFGRFFGLVRLPAYSKKISHQSCSKQRTYS
ncbi:MAG: hypothetical protein ACFB0A_16685 [Croceivirga sp.]